MGGGKSKVAGGGGGGSFAARVNALQVPSKPATFSDSRVSPLAYDKSKLMDVAFGGWREDKNFVGLQDVKISDIISVQPYVQANKLLSFKHPIDTTSVGVLQIGDKFYLGDGNHRIVAALLSGKKKVKVRVYRE